MKIIDRVEINYFRSIYSQTMKGLADVNVLIGKNDAGKSNFLKALNLFFNNQADFNAAFDFIRDLSRSREEEARDAKGRMTIWMKVRFCNFNNWNSLPSKFEVKRTWNRYNFSPEDSYPNDIPGSTMGRFLSGLSFHYIPAVRGREIFGHYLRGLHDSLMDDEKAGLKDSARSLMNEINQSTEDMAERIRRQLNVDSRIQVPENLQDLFAALDFATKFGDYDIPLQLRGDGIQARHVPFILDFIARHSKKSHIWAYEEPENSLEMSRAYELAQQFSTEFSQQNQIFLTTHSPAFYDLDEDTVSRWFVQSETVGPKGAPVSTITNISDSEKFDSELGMTVAMAKRYGELNRKLSEMEVRVEEFKEKWRKAILPQVITEGPSDAVIFSAAVEKICGDQFCDFIAGAGAGIVTDHIQSIDRLQAQGRPPVVGVYDNDDEGRRQMNKYRTKHLDGRDFLKTINREKKIYVGLLPVPEWLEDDLNSICEGPFSDFCPAYIEYMFPSLVLEDAISSGVLILEEMTYNNVPLGSIKMSVNATDEVLKYISSEHHFLAKKVSKESKMMFAEWIKHRPVGDFIAFRPFIEELQQTLGK